MPPPQKKWAQAGNLYILLLMTGLDGSHGPNDTWTSAEEKLRNFCLVSLGRKLSRGHGRRGAQGQWGGTRGGGCSPSLGRCSELGPSGGGVWLLWAQGDTKLTLTSLHLPDGPGCEARRHLPPPSPSLLPFLLASAR